jgi:hypothetical protein
MAQRAGSPTSKIRWDFGIRALLKLAGWGTAATVALLAVVMAAYSQTGSQRLVAALAPKAQSAPPTPVALATRSPEAERETRRLAEAVRTLSADRDRLLTRVVTLELSLEDITGSIRRQTSVVPPVTVLAPPSAAAASTALPLSMVAPAAREAPAPVADAPAAAPAAAPPLPEPAPAGARVAVVHPPEAAPEPAKPEVGVDIGGAVNFEGLRVLWNSTRNANATLFEGLHPLVLLRENARTRAPELRLVVGPIASTEAAARLCTTLSAARRYCQPAPFEGRELALAAPEPERRPPAAPPKATPAARPGGVTTAPRPARPIP